MIDRGKPQTIEYSGNIFYPDCPACIPRYVDGSCNHINAPATGSVYGKPYCGITLKYDHCPLEDDVEDDEMDASFFNDTCGR